MPRFDNILFDLDGTIIESAPGVTKSVQYALARMGIEEPDLVKLEYFVGPPLSQSFMDLYSFTQEQCGQAIDYYRERYSTIGIFECAPYAGIPELLRDLSAAGIRIAVASSKPQDYVLQILDHFGIHEYFTEAVGPGMEDDGDRMENGNDCKARVVRRALELLGAVGGGEHAAMVGDRAFDIVGGITNGVTPVGVVYGYGTHEELEEAGAAHIVDTVAELRTLLLG